MRKGRSPMGDVGIDEGIILKMDRNKYGVRLWIKLKQVTIRWWASVRTVMNLWISIREGKLLNFCTVQWVSLLKRG